MSKAVKDVMPRFNADSEAFIICVPKRDGNLDLLYQGNLRELKAMFRHIRDTLKDREKIGNHPNRPY